MFSIDLDCKQDAKDILIADLWEAGSNGIVELEDRPETARIRAFFDDDSLADDLVSRFGGKAEPADTRDWVAFAREHLHPMVFGERIFVTPEWRDDPTPEGRIRIVINAGLAFGTGAHETTRLCLEAVDRLVTPGCSVADVGCGSGILAEAAFKLGAGCVFACDNDPEAVTTANENFERAGIALRAVLGSAEEIPSASADLLLANISPAWIADLANEWLRILKPGGTAILSGFEGQDIPEVSKALVAAGAVNLQEYGLNSWRAMEIQSVVNKEQR